jgi:NSS family neurotransmitter:Na+ symporter
MSIETSSIHGEWSSRFAFFLAATGSAVGLGNIWKFPYITGQNGGGAFVIVYLVCILLVGMPVMIAEISLGRRGRQSPINTMRTLAKESHRSPLWQILGWGGVISGFLILSYYSVIAGWAVAYIPTVASGIFDSVQYLPENQIDDFVGSIFDNMVSNWEYLAIWHSLFMMITIIVVAHGVQNGLERAVKYMMPALFTLLLILVAYAMNTEKFMTGVAFMFTVDFSKISEKGILIAMGHSFFTLSLGMGAIMAYGAYLPKKTSILTISFAIVFADTLAALLAGLAIFPIVFSNGLEAAQGPGLVFNTLTVAFGKMPHGTFYGTLFFILLMLAAWTSAISLLEPVVAWLVESRKATRFWAAIGCGFIMWILGFVTIFSFNIWSNIKPLSFVPTFENKTWFDVIDFLTANIMLPLGGLFIAIFAAWFMKKHLFAEGLELAETEITYRILQKLLRFITPLGVAIVFLNAIGII